MRFVVVYLGVWMLPGFLSLAHADDPIACQSGVWRQVPHRILNERETWSFDVKWGVIKAGRAVLALEGMEPIRGRPAYHVSMDLRTNGVVGKIHPYHDRTDSWVDRDSLTTVLTRQSVRESHYQFDETVVLDPACQRFQQQENILHEKRTVEHQGRLPADALDLYSALFYLRTRPLAVGQSYDLVLFVSDKAVPVTAIVRRKERLSVGAGTFECFLIEMKTSQTAEAKKIKNVQWWVGVEDPHQPVRVRMKINIGHIAADLAAPRADAAQDN